MISIMLIFGELGRGYSFFFFYSFFYLWTFTIIMLLEFRHLQNFQENYYLKKKIYKQMGGTFHSIKKNCFALYLVKLSFQSNQCLCAIGVIACPQSSTHVLSRGLMQLRLRFAHSALHWFSNHSQPYNAISAAQSWSVHPNPAVVSPCYYSSSSTPQNTC